VFYGITADRDAVPDADTLGQCVLESLEELKDSASDTRPRAPRGRKGAGTRTRTPKAGRK
jgi:diacylglycerol O-acyltransferase